MFANQNVTKDPPFSHIDLLSCRNLLIYLGPVLQERIIPTFHFALKPTGFLVLGTAETIGGFSDLFSACDRKYKIYTKKPAAPQLPIGLGPPDFTARPAADGKEDLPRLLGREPIWRDRPTGSCWPSTGLPDWWSTSG